LKCILRIALAFLLSIGLLSCHEKAGLANKAVAIPLTFQAKVTGIKDGDTYNVLYNSQELTIRLAHIDCPEKKQPFSVQAKQFASALCFGREVTVKTAGKKDRYGRLIGEIILSNGTNVNKELVKNGLAWHFKKYSSSEEYAKLEVQARNLHIGLWVDTMPIAPWEWRHPSRNVLVNYASVVGSR